MLNVPVAKATPLLDQRMLTRPFSLLNDHHHTDHTDRKGDYEMEAGGEEFLWLVSGRLLDSLGLCFYCYLCDTFDRGYL